MKWIWINKIKINSGNKLKIIVMSSIPLPTYTTKVFKSYFCCNKL